MESEATEKQVLFLRKLARNNGLLKGTPLDKIDEAMETEVMRAYFACTKKVATRRIDKLIAQNKELAAKGAVIPEPVQKDIKDGFYKIEDAVFKVVHGRNDNQYAKQLEGSRWVYAPGAIRKLRTDSRTVSLSLTEAAAFGKLYGKCMCCGRTLTDEGSIAAGIGPICQGKYF